MNTNNTKQRFFKSGKPMTATEQAAIEAQEARDAKDPQKKEHWFVKNGRKARFGRFVNAMRQLTQEQTKAQEALKQKEADNGSN
jgi:hypothetical protein